MHRLGFIGTGTLAQAVIGGLQTTHAGRMQILLSPRSESVSRALAAAYPNVRRAESSVEVVEQSDILFLGMRPNQLDEAVASLPFREDHIVVSFLAGASIEKVLAAVHPVRHVVRVNPLPPIRFGKGPVVQYPANPLIEELFAGIGDLIVVDKESDLHAIGIVSALMSSHYELQNRQIGWLMAEGMAVPAATAYVRSMYDGLAEVTLDALKMGEPVIPQHHETKGGLNERGRAHLLETGWFEEAIRALDVIKDHASGLTRRP
jgi:pyrroline-5-carboxylate reductase